ncbi:GntR family transcriptional regulator [Leucobacter triazinivorans]|uniref:GntR family transcriptional regulator n=1 Tax=Leucobacter triazinivorans TaxID=1784719 RepID=A0A4P6KE25_9MICO|nr:GntR family transcriptional regulator [Leucobacter triazinivorans]
MLVRVNEASERPIYAQIADSVRGDILGGRIGPGTVLPPAREVATGLEVNVHTVLRAYQQLRDEGLIDLKRRRGAVVTARATGMAALHDEVRDLVERAAGLGIGSDALAALVQSAAGAAGAFGPGPGAAGAFGPGPGSAGAFGPGPGSAAASGPVSACTHPGERAA